MDTPVRTARGVLTEKITFPSPRASSVVTVCWPGNRARTVWYYLFITHHYASREYHPSACLADSSPVISSLRCTSVVTKLGPDRGPWECSGTFLGPIPILLTSYIYFGNVPVLSSDPSRYFLCSCRRSKQFLIYHNTLKHNISSGVQHKAYQHTSYHNSTICFTTRCGAPGSTGGSWVLCQVISVYNAQIKNLVLGRRQPVPSPNSTSSLGPPYTVSDPLGRQAPRLLGWHGSNAH